MATMAEEPRDRGDRNVGCCHISRRTACRQAFWLTEVARYHGPKTPGNDDSVNALLLALELLPHSGLAHPLCQVHQSYVNFPRINKIEWIVSLYLISFLIKFRFDNSHSLRAGLK